MNRRALTITLVAVAALMIGTVVHLPSPAAMRDWARAAGPWFPLVFLAAHTVITVLPFPRTALTLAAGLLFGPALGIALAVGASTASALIALWVVRALGWQLSSLAHRPGFAALDARLSERGWVAVLATRLIPIVPFSVLNYAAGASSVRVGPYLLASVAGLLPGTAAVVILGDALTGRISPALLAVSLCTGAIGIAGLVYETRVVLGHRHR